MKFVSDPPIAAKIRNMKQRVRWQEPLIVEQGIDQTRIVFADDEADSPEFSFLVMGDTGSGRHRGHDPQRQIAEMMLTHKDQSRFVLHTGDVVYLVGSSEFYPDNFIKPYREFIVGGEHPQQIAFDQMVFNLPFLPVPGNHDYYDLPIAYGLLAGTTQTVRRLLRSQLYMDIGWHGSYQGKAYAQAFLDYLKQFDTKEKLSQHLDSYYTAQTDTGRCLRYEPKRFTRLPNRYYTFRHGGIDFFALDSNTFNDPLPLSAIGKGEGDRRLLAERRQQFEQEKQQIIAESAKLNPKLPDEAERLDDLRAKLQQLEELQIDIDKQLSSRETPVTDIEQLNWLQQRLIESWHTTEVRGRVIYLHHPPYVTEATKWHQAQTLAIRYRLRQVFDAASKEIGTLADGRPLVDLILSGHAHCLEYLRTGNTGHADSNTNWIVCGGSGYSLRRQRTEGPELSESFANGEGSHTDKVVARSLLFIGRSGQGLQRRRPYSFVRIDVQDGKPPKFIVRPYIAEWSQQKWSNSKIEPFTI